MADIEITGAQRIAAALASLGSRGPVAIGAGLFQEAEAIMVVSKERYVPVDTGTLRATGFVEPPRLLPGQVSVRLGFGGPAAPYALRVHENPRSGKTGGISPSGKPYAHYAKVGEWKFLETPVKAATAGLLLRLAARVERSAYVAG